MSLAEPLFLPPDEAATLYAGEVMHARLKPKAHRFAYRVFSLLIDLDRLDAADRLSRVFSVDRFNLVSFSQADHGAGRGALAAELRETLRSAGVELDGGRILLLCYPRILGHVFNPLATYWCYGPSGDLRAVVYEVTNTFRERHCYVAPVREGELTPSGLRQSRDKLMYVSPFLDMGMVYAFRLRPPGRSVRLRILQSDADGPILSATFAGEKRPLTGAAIAKLCAAVPLLGVKVVAAIHWEALRLWLKGVTLVERPPAPEARYSFDTPGAIRHGSGGRRRKPAPSRRHEPASVR